MRCHIIGRFGRDCNKTLAVLLHALVVRCTSPHFPSLFVGRGTGGVTKLLKEVTMPSLRQFCK
jgi:hypothetical protein